MTNERSKRDALFCGICWARWQIVWSADKYLWSILVSGASVFAMTNCAAVNFLNMCYLWDNLFCSITFNGQIHIVSVSFLLETSCPSIPWQLINKRYLCHIISFIKSNILQPAEWCLISVAIFLGFGGRFNVRTPRTYSPVSVCACVCVSELFCVTLESCWFQFLFVLWFGAADMCLYPYAPAHPHTHTYSFHDHWNEETSH